MPPMRIAGFWTVLELFEHKGWVQDEEEEYVLVSPNGLDTVTIYVHPDSEHQTVSVEFLLEELRERGLDKLADWLYRRL